MIAKALFELDQKYEPITGNVVNHIKGVSYVEVQVLGTLSVDDASALVISKNESGWEARDILDRYPRLSDFYKNLTSLREGLPVRFAGESSEDTGKI